MKKFLFLSFIILVVPTIQVIGMSNEDKFREAVESGNITEIKDLITTKKIKVDYYPLNINYDTALMVAVEKNNIEMAKELLLLGADINKKNNLKATPLTLAIKADNLSMVEMLLHNSKDVDRTVNRSGEDITVDDKLPLLLAIKRGNIEIIKAILNEVPDLNIKNDYSALDYAKELKNTDLKNKIVSLLETALKQYALYQCADNFKDCNESNFTPDVLKQTITNPRRNPLFAAILAGADGNSKAVELFIKKGLNVNQIARGGITPLMAAAQDGRYNMIKLLLQNNANPLIKNAQGETALDILKTKKSIDYTGRYDNAITALTEAEARWKKTKVELPNSNLFDSLKNLTQQLRTLYKSLNNMK